MSLFKAKWYVLGISLFLAMGCSRGSNPSASLKLQVPRQLTSKVSGKVGAQSAALEQLSFAALNVQLPGASKPAVYKFEFDNENGTAAGTGDVVLELNDVPIGSALVQFIGVYENGSTGLMTFRYGDKAHEIVDGDNQVQITATVMGTSSQEYVSTGRYFTGDSTGPTGRMTMHVHPPGDKPKMDIQQVEFFNGWFEVFHPGGGIQMSYSNTETGETVLGPFDETHNIFTGVDTANSRVSRYQTPQYYEPRDGGEVRPSTVYTLGYFRKNNSITPSGFASLNVCHLTSIEAVAGVFADSGLSTVLKWDPSGSNSDLYALGGNAAQPATSYDYFYGNVSCQPATAIRFLHHKAREHGEAAAGRRGPFRLVQPGKDYGGFLGAYMYDNSSAFSIKLHWKLWPGAETGLGGFKLLAKYSSGGDEGGGGDRSCQKLIDEQGYLEVTDLTSSADEYVFSGGSGLPSLDTNNYHGFRFALCPVFADGKLARTYIESSCVNGCYSPNTGRKVPGETGHDETIIGGDPASSKGGAYARVVSTTRQVDHGLELSLSDTVNMAGFQAGDDIMLTVVSEKSGRCTVSPFPSVGPGMVSVARVTKVQTAPDKLFISSGTFLDGIDVADLGSTADSGVNHCYVMATRIIEFGDLTIDDTRELYADPLTISTAGGVLALRVSGTLDMGANALLNASEKGYNGGNYSPGGGVAGFASTVSSHTGGNEFTAPDGGGGGGSSFGRGGDSSVSAGNTFGSNFDYAALLFGGGGGAGKETSVSKDGGDGAGSVYVVANKVQVSGSGAPGYILANGGNGTTAATGGGGGGGAGGSVNLYMRSLSSVLSQPLQLSAAGGNGGAGATNGGVGGGGYVYMDYCSGGVSAANYITDVSKGATGSSTSATDGQVQIRTDSHFCEN